jgi:hypothetical protein
MQQISHNGDLFVLVHTQRLKAYWLTISFVAAAHFLLNAAAHSPLIVPTCAATV